VPKLRRSISIHAPVEQVFEYVDDPEKLPEVWPSLIEVHDVKRMPNGGPKFRFVYKLAGVRFNGVSETTEFELNRRHVVKNSDGRPDGLEATLTWTFAPDSGGTRMDVEADYRMPRSLLGRFAEPFIMRTNEHEMEAVLANIKARLER
jgi:uncharacterized protein YndB with AHSA1/START domain